MLTVLKTVDSVVVRIINPIVIAVGLLVAVLLVVGIISRAFLSAPIFGLEEVMLLAIMWFYMLGASLASRERSHLTADFVGVMTSNPRVRRGALIVSTAISLFVAVMFVSWSWSLLSFGLERGQSTPVFGIPWWVSQSSMFVASILFVAYLVRDLVLELTRKNSTPGDTSAEVE